MTFSSQKSNSERFTSVFTHLSCGRGSTFVHICSAQSSLNTMNIHDFESSKVKKPKGFCKFHLKILKFDIRKKKFKWYKWELVGGSSFGLLGGTLVKNAAIKCHGVGESRVLGKGKGRGKPLPI